MYVIGRENKFSDNINKLLSMMHYTSTWIMYI